MSAAPRRGLRLREWSRVDPDDPTHGATLRGLRLNGADRRMLAELRRRSTLRVEERRDGLSISIGPHVGAVTLSELQLVILPKMAIEQLGQLIAYSFRISDLVLSPGSVTLRLDDFGMLDLLAWSLLRAVERVARGGLLPEYVPVSGRLSSPRGRIDLRRVATAPPSATLPCHYETLTLDHALNRALADGLRWTAGVVSSRALRLDLRRAADRLFGELTRTRLDGVRLAEASAAALSRRASHYRLPLELLTLLFHGHQSGPQLEHGGTQVGGFLLDMNLLFERFLTRYLREFAPPGVEVFGQHTRAEVFTYLENPAGWRHPQIRPDLVFKRGEDILLVADAKYRNRHENPPTTAELYQLTTYGLAFEMRPLRRVAILHPLGEEERDRPAVIRFSPDNQQTHVEIHLCGVPLDALLRGECRGWWPLESVIEWTPKA